MNSISFVIPAMPVSVHTKVNNRTVVKRDAAGRPITVNRILPKARARFGGINKKGKVITFTNDKTRNFEEWIRAAFFKTYPGFHGVFINGQCVATHSSFLGCTWFGETTPCVRFRTNHNFSACKTCDYRRKNLKLTMEAHLIDDRHIDLDNIEKIALDALNRVCFYDDGQFSEKFIKLVPFSAEEKMVVRIDTLPEVWDGMSICNAYKLKNLSASAATTYAQYLTVKLLQPILETDWLMGYASEGVIAAFIRYLHRADGRAYINQIELDIKAGKYNEQKTNSIC